VRTGVTSKVGFCLLKSHPHWRRSQQKVDGDFSTWRQCARAIRFCGRCV